MKPEAKPEAEIIVGLPPLRPYVEIHFAHDLLDSVVEDEEIRRNLSPEDPNKDLKLMIAARDVLCWVLEHDNPDFEDNLARLVKRMIRAGYAPRPIEAGDEQLEQLRRPPQREGKKPS